MDIPDYKAKYGEPKTLEDILNYCAFISGQGGLEHRTLHHFDYFVSSLIFGESQYKDFERAYKDTPVPTEGTPKYFSYIIWKSSAEDSLKIYQKYHHIYQGWQEERPLINYAVAFMEYCETEYGDMTEP